MSFFKGLFGRDEGEDNISSGIEWVQLTNKDQLDEIDIVSIDIPVIIFKHSTRCGISRMVLKQFENEFIYKDKFKPYFLDLLNFRNISNEIAIRYNIEHQSPQLLVVKDGYCIYNASHGDISYSSIEKLF